MKRLIELLDKLPPGGSLEEEDIEQIMRVLQWASELDTLVENRGEDRDWHGGEIGWVYPGQAAYYGDIRPILQKSDKPQ